MAFARTLVPARMAREGSVVAGFAVRDALDVAAAGKAGVPDVLVAADADLGVAVEAGGGFAEAAGWEGSVVYFQG